MNPAWQDELHKGESCHSCGTEDCVAKVAGVNVWCTWYQRRMITGTREVGESANPSAFERAAGSGGRV